MKKKTVRMRVTHAMNPLHVYCRLRGFGLSGQLAMRLCQLYERVVYLPCARLMPARGVSPACLLSGASVPESACRE